VKSQEVVTEQGGGSNVVLNVNDFLEAKDININDSYSWKQTGGTPLSNNVRKENSTISFTAPYVKGNDLNTSLSFELTIKDNSGKTRDSSYNANVIGH
jgi:hypothetical protein